MDEARVIAQIRWGKLAAFGEIVEHYQAPIIRYLSRMTGNAEVGKDFGTGHLHPGISRRV